MMYLVSYSTGSYDTYYQEYVFVTADEQMAIAYTEKFNRILNNLKDYFKKNISDSMWDDSNKYDWYRWTRIMETDRATYQMINVR